MAHYKECKLIEPMRELFEVIMEKLKTPSIAQFAEVIPPLTIPGREKNIDSQKRQIHRRLSGKIPPNWENIRSISDTFFGGDDGPMVSYGVARFLQSLLQELRDNHTPTFFEEEKDLVSIFQEQSKWQEFHSKSCAKWSKAKSNKELLASS
ncbi:hypothetical protein SYK_28340 [Pseudodesulfovibrio nedwellii]|uniref:Uncharacterized protein n=1 Tax=Pseudodesulfovibrio nedwellii TaxID=2973072 RepID=A0ABM8B3Z0_9BACT|nr:hypothetical protein [Pseudodesulfovibrio nedwellii]BDQ38474.1 hypothetical protein SYK_28340 [Pseudodesulfovibrio nedwellii]